MRALPFSGTTDSIRSYKHVEVTESDYFHCILSRYFKDSGTAISLEVVQIQQHRG